ncbi:MAG: molybdenum cofactor biosynthesis protein MoaE [Oligoflexia bacterium]|nr:molybdenum cofactor biosynthesis protein MoaE [Oligoflexia bacterium]
MASRIVGKVVSGPLTHEQVIELLDDPTHGAQLLFWGIVRNLNDGRSVEAVTYDAHAPLCERVFEELGTEVLAKWGEGLRIVILHRVGRLKVGEASLVIGVGSAHRDESYQASRYLIEEIKKRAPVWKQEHYVDGDSEWIRGHSLAKR